MKRIFAVSLCALLLAGMLSCGKADAPADTTVADTTVADTTAADTTVADTTAADTTVADTTAADTTVADTTVADTTEEEEYIPGETEWSFDEATGTLTVSGTGAMENYLEDGDFGTTAPWMKDHKQTITRIVIEEGITAIGDNSFGYLYQLAEINIPAGLKKVGKDAFTFDYSLTDVNYAGSEEQWEKIAIGNGNYLLKEATRHYAE